MGQGHFAPQVAEETGATLDVVTVNNFHYRRQRFTVYVIRVKFSGYAWVVCKRFKEVAKFARSVKPFIPANVRRPSKTLRRNTSKNFVLKRKPQLEHFLRAIVAIPGAWASHQCREFFEIGRLSFSRYYGRKGKEGWLKKMSGGRRHVTKDGLLPHNSKRRWFILKDGFIAYFSSPHDSRPKGIMLVDQHFTIFSSPHVRYMKISNGSRELIVKARSRRELDEWLIAMRQMYGHSVRRHQHPNASFAPIRGPCPAMWMVDGRAAYSCMAAAILAARREVFIAGWWISPNINMVRAYGHPVTSPSNPSLQRDAVSLLDLLVLKANEGVKV